MLFESKNLKEKQKELREMAYIDHLEELGKVDVSDLDMDIVNELQQVLESLNYITEYENDYLVLKNAEEKRQYRTNEVERSLFKNKGSGGGLAYRVSLPIDFLRELGMESDNRVLLSIEDSAIIIRRKEGA